MQFLEKSWAGITMHMLPSLDGARLNILLPITAEVDHTDPAFKKVYASVKDFADDLKSKYPVSLTAKISLLT